MAGEPAVSPLIQSLIDKGLFDRLPATFSTYFFEQFQDWHLLFPAERSYQERLFALLDQSDPQAVESLFAPLRQTESLMGINEKTWPRRRFTVDQVEFLQRSPQYQQWRQAIARVFARLDPLVEAEIARHGRPRLIVMTAPAELPTGPDRTWLRLQDRGQRIALDVPEGQDYFKQLLAGGTGKPISQLYTREPYDSWEIAAGKFPAGGERVVSLSYDELKSYRLRLMEEVRRIVESGEARTPQQLSERMKKLNVLAPEADFAKDEILAEFVRAVLLNGNGTLLINNTFVEWASVQAARRARPSVMVLSFGVRNKLKPFSSLLIHADQETANPIPTQMDSLGTYVDLEVFYQYLWQEFEKYAEYRKNTAYLFVGDGMDELFCIAPADFPLLSAKTPVKPATVFAAMKDWLVLPK
jgi:hypothetical protein